MIDDWRFKNRIATRADAIRRLCQIGMMFDDNRMELMALLGKVVEPATKLPNVLNKHNANIDNPQSLSGLDRDLIRIILQVTSALASMTVEMRTVVGVAKNYKSRVI